MDHETIIEFRGITFGFSHQAPLFSNLSLVLKKGTFYGIQGPSGAGKTTFLRLINRLEEPASGEIRFKETPINAYTPPTLRRSLLYVQQVPTVLDGTVEENLLLPFSFKSNRHLKRPCRNIMENFMEKLHLQNIRLQDHAMTLSAGQLQRLCIIRGLLLRPEVLMLDEPLSALDQDSAVAVMALLKRLHQKSGLTLLLISHKTDVLAGVIQRYLKVADGDVRPVS